MQDLTDSGSMMAFCQGSCLQNITNVYSECPGVEENFILSIIEGKLRSKEQVSNKWHHA